MTRVIPIVKIGLCSLYCALLYTAHGHASLENPSRYRHWEIYGDFLYMDRNWLHNEEIVVDDVDAVIETKNLLHRFSFEPGYRAGLLYTPNERFAFDGCFSRVQPWSGRKTVEEEGSLSVPFNTTTYDPGMTQGDQATGYYNSSYWDAQLNLIRFFTPQMGQYFTLSGLAGARFFHIDEKFFIDMIKDSYTSSYEIKTDNRIVGAQLGLDFQMHPVYPLVWEINGKVGFFADNARQSQSLNDESSGTNTSIRNSHEKKWQLGWYTDVLGRLRFDFATWCDLHIGYEVIFLTGVALAPEQISMKTDANAGKKDYTNGNIVIQGLVAGGTIRF